MFCPACCAAVLAQRIGENCCIPCFVPGGLIAMRTKIRLMLGIRVSSVQMLRYLLTYYLFTSNQIHLYSSDHTGTRCTRVVHGSCWLVDPLCIQILSFSYSRHPSNSSSSSSFYSHSSCKFTCLQQTCLLQFTLLWHLTNKSQQTSTQSKFIGTCHYKHFKISTHHTNTQKTRLASNQTKNRLQNLSSHIQNTYKSTTYISLQ